MSVDLERIRGWCCPCPATWPADSVFLVALQRPELSNGTAVGQRINGVVECPRCGLEWPLIEEPEEWQTDPFRVRYWGPGTAECTECGIAIVSTSVGTYVIE